MDPIKFYDNLKLAGSLRDVLKPEIYTPLPDDWYVAVTDIRGSTDAIRIGKYKEVNMAGASVIAALSNAFGHEIDLPFLFGGDGSLIAIPNHNIDQVKGYLSFCRTAVKNAYGLQMDTGLVSVKEIRENGHDISVARLSLSEFVDQAVFWGSGVTWVEDLVKQKDLLSGVEPIEASFSGLECRWNQLPSKKDEVAAYIIQTVGETDIENADLYDEIFKKIEQVYGGEDQFHPIYKEKLKMTTKLRFLRVEWKLRIQPPSLRNKIRFIFQITFQYLMGIYLMKFGKKTSETDWSLYKPDLIKHADYKKFGDGLRFVATGTVEQRMELTAYLDKLFAEKKLAYGVHPSFAAMITCYVKKYQREHIHFVDGTDGGYAKASQELKTRRDQLDLK